MTLNALNLWILVHLFFDDIIASRATLVIRRGRWIYHGDFWCCIRARAEYHVEAFGHQCGLWHCVAGLSWLLGTWWHTSIWFRGCQSSSALRWLFRENTMCLASMMIAAFSANPKMVAPGGTRLFSTLFRYCLSCCLHRRVRYTVWPKILVFPDMKDFIICYFLITPTSSKSVTSNDGVLCSFNDFSWPAYYCCHMDKRQLSFLAKSFEAVAFTSSDLFLYFLSCRFVLVLVLLLVDTPEVYLSLSSRRELLSFWFRRSISMRVFSGLWYNILCIM